MTKHSSTQAENRSRHTGTDSLFIEASKVGHHLLFPFCSETQLIKYFTGLFEIQDNFNLKKNMSNELGLINNYFPKYSDNF